MKRMLAMILAVAATAPTGATAVAATNAVPAASRNAAANDVPAANRNAAASRKTSAAAPLIPAREWRMIREVAVNYGLSEEATWLLAAIRRHENGRPGLEFGIGGPMNSGHRAHRYQDGTKSFYVQALWAAGTIRKHFNGDVCAFGKRYNPKHPEQWSRAVSSLILRLKVENHYRLPGEKPPLRTLSFP